MAARPDGLFSGRTSIRAPRERTVALSLLITVPVTLAVIGLVFHGITPTQVALLFVGGMVFVSLTRGRLLGSSIRARPEEFPQVVEIVERLSRRLGIPISLSVVYMEIARRLDRPIAGVGLPGHFIVVYEDGASRYWVDPFHSGRILSFEDCCVLARDAAGADLASHPAMLEPLSNRQILVRMLGNLKAIYLRGQAFDKARVVLDLMIDAMPAYAEGYRERGLVYLRQMNFRSAKSDLESFLRLDPDSKERADAEHQLVLIERWKADLN